MLRLHVPMQILERPIAARANAFADAILDPRYYSSRCGQLPLYLLSSVAILDRPLPVILFGLSQSLHVFLPMRFPKSKPASLGAKQCFFATLHIRLQL